jgi:ELWxxDGT repeat protein
VPALPELVKDIKPGLLSSAPKNLTIFNNKLFFTAFGSGSGAELWVSDGTTAGTQLVKDIRPGSSDSDPQDLTVFNGKLYFTAKDGSATGRELWVSDGTAAGTQLFKDIYRGAPYVLEDDNDPTGLTVFNGRLFFSANDGINGRELWSTDGTAAGTQLFKDINPGRNSSSSPFSSDPTNFIVFNGKLIFSALEASTARELWISDGTAAGTQLLKDIATRGTGSTSFWGSAPKNFTILGDKLFFTATEWSGTGEELWMTDGTTAGTQLVKDINLGTYSSSPQNLTVVNDKLFFSANDGTNGQELWVSDGTAAGTQLVKDIYPFVAPFIRSSSPENLTVFNGKVFFSANDGTNGREVWSSDGTASGTQLLKVISPGTSGTDYNPIGFTVFDGKLFISIDNGTNGTELWSSDGTTAGTQLFADIFSGVSGSAPGQFTVLGNKLFFTATGGNAVSNNLGVELWKLDLETPNIAIAPTNADRAEGNSGTTPFTFTVTRTGNTSAASSVQYGVTGSGANPANAIDFGTLFPTGTVNFAANQTTAMITLNVKGDTAIELDEGFTVTLRNAINATITNRIATGIIRNDDIPPSLRIIATSANKLEGNSGNTPFTFNVTRSGNISAASSVQYAVTGSGINPANATDFGTIFPTGTVNFAANQTTATITLNVKGDRAVELDEGFTVTLRNAINATIANGIATGIIRNDDIPPSLRIIATSANKLEGNSGNTPFTFNVTRSGNISAASSVQYSVTGSGINPANAIDFGTIFPTGTVNFAANQTTAIITLNVKGDRAVELDEGFTVTLGNTTNATIANGIATGIIRNDDIPPILRIAPINADRAEGNSGNTPFTFNVTRSGNISAASSVQYSVTGSGASPARATDFGTIFPTGIVNFAANQTTAMITLNVKGDTAIESNEGFTVILRNATNATITNGIATGTIRNDDRSTSQRSVGTSLSLNNNIFASDGSINQTSLQTRSIDPGLQGASQAQLLHP